MCPQTTEQKIRDAAIKYVTEIRAKEKSLIDDLHALYGAELMEYVNRKNEMQNNLDGLKSTCQLTELVLKGKDIELLLLKKQVQDKLENMAHVELKDLPTSVGHQVDFVEGSVNLGALEDPNKPLEKPPKESAGKTEENNNVGSRKAKQNRSIVNSLPNMTFASRRRNSELSDEEIKVEKVEKVEKVSNSTQSTQTDKAITQSGVRTVGRCIQTEFYIPEAGYQAWREPAPSNG